MEICILSFCTKEKRSKDLCASHYAMAYHLYGTELPTDIEDSLSSDKGKYYAKSSWLGAKGRCFNENHYSYYMYGKIGTTMCMGWANSFAKFYSDMGDRDKELSLDRIDSTGNYSCGECDQCAVNGWRMNCRWATKQQQIDNRQKGKLQKFGRDGLIYTTPGITYDAKRDRYYVYRYINGKRIRLGSYYELIDAQKATR